MVTTDGCCVCLVQHHFKISAIVQHQFYFSTKMERPNKRALPKEESSQSTTKKRKETQPLTSRITCTHILEMFKVKKALSNLLKIDSSVMIATSRMGSMWRARCKFHDLNCTQDDVSESLAKEKVAGSIIHELILRRDPLLDRLPICHGIMNLPRDEYIQGLVWNVYGDLEKVQIEKRRTASAGGIGSQFKYAKIYVNNIAHEAMLPGQDNAKRSVFCAAFSTLAGVIAPPREADPALAPPIPTRVSPQRAIALLKKLKPTAVLSYVPRFAVSEESSREFIKTWKATVKLDGKAYHAETSEKMSSLEQAALLALSALHIVDDPELLDVEPRQQHPTGVDNPQSLNQADVTTQSKENRDESGGRLKSKMRGETSIERNLVDDARNGRSKSNKMESKKDRDSSSDSSSSSRSSSSDSSGGSSERSRSTSSSSTGSVSSSCPSDSSGSSRPPGSDQKRPRKRASSVDSKMRLANHRHERSSPKDGLGESQQQECVVRPPPIIRQEHYLQMAQQQPIGPWAIHPTWGQMDATGRMKGSYYDPSAQLETHHTFPFSVGSIARMQSPGFFSQNSGVPVNHPFHDSVGRHALNNVRFPFTANRFQYSGPSPTMNYPAIGSVQNNYSSQQNLMVCDTSIPPPPPNMWPLHYQQFQQDQRYPPQSQPVQQQSLGYSTGSRFMPPYQPEPGNFNRPPPQVPLTPAPGPSTGPVSFLASPSVMHLRPPPPRSGCPAPSQSDDERTDNRRY